VSALWVERGYKVASSIHPRCGLVNPSLRSLYAFLAMVCYTVRMRDSEARSVAEKPTVQKRRYLSYLLRLWQESGGSPWREPPLWRASLQSPQSRERLGFASLADLFAYLEDETRSSSSGSVRSDKGG
jgi:hypothetical protein